MKKLQDILYKVALEGVRGSTAVEVDTITFDSRKLEGNTFFVAIRGAQVDGHNFIESVVNAGAVAVLCEYLPENLDDTCTYIVVKDSNQALAQVASNFYGNPSEKLTLVGVTGTNGKTTIATLLYQLFTKAGHSCGLLSTVKILIGDQEYPATHTTPDSLTINRYMRAMLDHGITHCFMEVSSHGIHQHRTYALDFDAGIFTNLSHDHLDYHHSFAEYRDVKKKFFDQLSPKAFALVNIDDKNGLVMLQNSSAKKITYGLKSIADFKGQILENQLEGLLLKINDKEVWVRLIGSFNASNVLAIYGTAVSLGMESLEVLRLLSELKSVAGRFQYIISEQKITAIVDYAHTPDALKNVLETINDVRTKNERLITVVGCGGDRDSKKRPVMGEIAATLSDYVIFTSDNPRTESPTEIIKQMEAGVPVHLTKKTISIEDRFQAIRLAVQQANPKDIILIAGKGHETYQEINGIRHHFDDMETVKEILNQFEK